MKASTTLLYLVAAILAVITIITKCFPIGFISLGLYFAAIILSFRELLKDNFQHDEEEK